MSKVMTIVAELREWWRDEFSGEYDGVYVPLTVSKKSVRYTKGQRIFNIQPAYALDHHDYWVIHFEDILFVLYKDRERRFKGVHRL